MRKILKSIFAVGISLCFATTLAKTTDLHPDIQLLDSNSVPVVESGLAMSAVNTCADCHDGQFILANHDHPTHIASNCLLCHSRDYDVEAFFELRQSATPSWATLAGLANKSLAETRSGEWHWSESTMLSNGLLDASELNIEATKSAACGACHGIVHNDSSPLVINGGDPIGRLTGTEGAIYSGQKLSVSGLNIADKANQSRSFDVHAERLLECTDCHRAANNPVHGGAHGNSLSHLKFDPRQVDLSDFLLKPDHNLVIGASGGDGSCLGCHAPEENHSWLPEAEVHFEKIACQACHITELFGPAIALIDDTVRDPEGNTVVVRRGQKPTGSSLAGFQPLLLQRPLDGKYAPYNVSMIRFWRDAKNNQSVAPSIINKAWQSSGLSLAAYDGHLNETEINLLKAELIALGISQPEIATRIDTAAINHGVSRDSFALKDCNTCHSDESRLQASLKLGTVNPDFVSPASIHAKGNPALNLHIDINNQLSATGVNQDIDYNLKRVHPVLAFIVGLLLLVAVLTGWQWFRNNRR